MTAATKEVTTDDADHPMYLEVFTVPEFAKFLGRTPLTVKRWISDRLLPPPILRCTTYGYAHYSKAEATIIEAVLLEHMREYEYLHHTHSVTINRLWQSVEAYRKSHM